MSREALRTQLDVLQFKINGLEAANWRLQTDLAQEENVVLRTQPEGRLFQRTENNRKFQ